MTGRSSAKRTGLCLLALFFCFSSDNVFVVGEPEPFPAELLYSESFVNNAENLVSLLRSSPWLFLFFLPCISTPWRAVANVESTDQTFACLADPVEQAEAGDPGEENAGRRANDDPGGAGDEIERQSKSSAGRLLRGGAPDAQCHGWSGTAFWKAYRDKL